MLPEILEAPSLGGNMNTRVLACIMACVAAGALALAWLVVHFEGSMGLTKYAIGAAVIALLTMTVVWRVIFWITQIGSKVIATGFHFVGNVFDKVADWAHDRRQRLSNKPRAVPNRDGSSGDDARAEEVGLDIIRG